MDLLQQSSASSLQLREESFPRVFSSAKPKLAFPDVKGLRYALQNCQLFLSYQSLPPPTYGADVLLEGHMSPSTNAKTALGIISFIFFIPFPFHDPRQSASEASCKARVRETTTRNNSFRFTTGAASRAKSGFPRGSWMEIGRRGSPCRGNGTASGQCWASWVPKESYGVGWRKSNGVRNEHWRGRRVSGVGSVDEGFEGYV